MCEDFKLLAITPLEKCEKRFSKNLVRGELYEFYKEFEYFDVNDTKEKNPLKIDRIKKNQQVPGNLYNLKNGLSVNISAVVGKNGSGKSTLLELYYALCFVLACKADIIKTYEKKKDRNSKEEDWYNFVQKIFRELQVGIVYTYNDKIYSLQSFGLDFIKKIYERKGDVFVARKPDPIEDTDDYKKFLFENFPYSVVINYSLYGLNSESMGEWIQRLFHKNDGYQTPLVINPFRNEGNIDVNNELHLAQTRLMTNMVVDKNNREINHHKITKFDFQKVEENDDSTKKNKLEYEQVYSNYLKKNGIKYLEFLRKIDDIIYDKEDKFNGLKQIDDSIEEEVSYLAKYVFRKILKISRYPDYETISIRDTKDLDFEKFEKLCSNLKDDRTHITLKLRQVLNMVRFNLYPKDWKVEEDDGITKYSNRSELDSILQEIGKLKEENEVLELDELIPIGCYRINLLAKPKDDNKDRNNFSLSVMSSGEQHFVHSIHSILYHILNVDSVSKNSSSNRIKYRFVNIILDEIELYYHPEFQQKFVFDLLKLLEGQKFKNVRGVNILFSTHSPFILSDIPDVNILRLKNGEVRKGPNAAKTLGANIHELLYNDFFLKDSFMGEFVRCRIKSLIDHLGDEAINDKNEDKCYSEVLPYKWDRKSAELFISQIGEPVLKETLTNLYIQKYGMTEEMIDKEIERLQNLKKGNDSN